MLKLDPRWRGTGSIFSFVFLLLSTGVSGAQTIATVAGTGVQGFGGDGGLATSAQFGATTGVAVDDSGNLFVTDQGNHRIRRVDATTGLISTVAGGGLGGDGGPATSAFLNGPVYAAVDTSESVFISDRGNFRVRRVDSASGIITTVAGTGTEGFNGDDQPATSAQLGHPQGLAVNASGDLYIADHVNHRVRKVAAGTGVITTVAGTGVAGFSGDGGPATSAQINNPGGLLLDSDGNLFIADHENHRIRKLDLATGIITSVAGTGVVGYSGDGGPATDAQLYFPWGLAVDLAGNLFIADEGNHRIRRVARATGIITTIAGTGTAGLSGDGGLATSAQLNGASGIAFDGDGNLFISDRLNYRVRSVALFMPVQIDIKPGVFPNHINLGSGGTVQVAILSGPSFDALTVDPLSVTLAGAPVRLKPNGAPMTATGDVDGDGFLDLIVRFNIQALQLNETDTRAALEGRTVDDTAIQGTDSVQIGG